jgi:hypothetical protein
MVYPAAGIANSTGSAWGTSYTTTGSGTVVALASSPVFATDISVHGLTVGKGAASLDNIALGINALSNASTTGTGNVGIGRNTLNVNTSGIGNIAIGDYALSTNTTGSNNIGFGGNALTSNAIGSNNVGIGNVLINSNSDIGTGSTKYSHTLNEYEKVFESIKNNVQTKHLKSIINLKINNILNFVEIVKFSIHMNSGYSCIEQIFIKKPSLFFGSFWTEHSNKLGYVSVENYKEPILIIDENKIRYITNQKYPCISSEIDSETIVSAIHNFDREYNYFTKV